MRRRIAAAAVLAVGVALTLVGCTLLSPQSTLITYDPSDGTSINVGVVQVRNAFAISPDGTDANFVGTMINNGTKDLTVEIQYTTHTDGKAVSESVGIPLPAGDVIPFGNSALPQLVFRNANVPAGSLLKIFIQYGSVSGKNLRIPVLDGSQAAYKNLAPSPTPAPTSTAPVSCATSTVVGCTQPTSKPTATATPAP